MCGGEILRQHLVSRKVGGAHELCLVSPECFETVGQLALPHVKGILLVHFIWMERTHVDKAPESDWLETTQLRHLLLLTGSTGILNNVITTPSCDSRTPQGASCLMQYLPGQREPDVLRSGFVRDGLR